MRLKPPGRFPFKAEAIEFPTYRVFYMNYLIAVLPDRIQAEAAYSALEKEGLPMKQVSILGRGYKTADEFGLIDPNEQANKQAKLMAVWLVPFGFIAGVTFSLMTQLKTFAWAGEIGGHAIGGVLGAIAPKPKIFHAKTVGQDRMQIQFKLHKGKLQPSREILPLV